MTWDYKWTSADGVGVLGPSTRPPDVSCAWCRPGAGGWCGSSVVAASWRATTQRGSSEYNSGGTRPPHGRPCSGRGAGPGAQPCHSPHTRHPHSLARGGEQSTRFGANYRRVARRSPTSGRPGTIASAPPLTWMRSEHCIPHPVQHSTAHEKKNMNHEVAFLPRTYLCACVWPCCHSSTA